MLSAIQRYSTVALSARIQRFWYALSPRNRCRANYDHCSVDRLACPRASGRWAHENFCRDEGLITWDHTNSSCKKLPDVGISLSHRKNKFTSVNRNISAFAHIPDKELYIFPSSMSTSCCQITLTLFSGQPHQPMTPHFPRVLKDWLTTHSLSPSQRWCRRNSMEVQSKS